MSILEKWIDNKIIQNIFVWCCVLFILFIIIGGIEDQSEGLLTIICMAMAVYINNYFIIPYFNIKTIQFVSFFIINVSFFSLISSYLVLDEFSLKNYFRFFGNFFLAVSFGMALRIARDSFYRRQQERESELKLLKAQLNPHFLFNTLNNLYGLSVVKSDKLPDLMLQLSDLLRYSLYETKEVFVSLEKEIGYLENYISLERIRLEKKTTINFIVKGNVIEKQIAPMLLIVFVENAFKHLGNEKDKKSCVAISLEVIENTLHFKCKNSFNTIKIIEEDLEKGKSGIGLTNVKKRLALIYPEVHKLSIIEDEDFFNVDLTLDL